MARKAISKKLRFDVFKRDGFACQYCGATPPAVVLHVDHIDPVANGGGNHIDNLTTACEPCNLGKSATPLSAIPKSLEAKSAEAAEREEQIKGYNAILTSARNRIDDEAWKVAAALKGVECVEKYETVKLQSIKTFLKRLPFPEVQEAAEIAASRKQGTYLFRYFCGICWSKIREVESGSR